MAIQIQSGLHPTAVIDPSAEIDPAAEIGPFVVIEANVRVGAGTKIGPFAHIQGITEIGANNSIGTGCTLGHPPQHLEYRGAPTKLIIGNNNTIREYVSIHRAYQEGAATVIEDDCFLMGFCHVAHDCRVESGAIIANGALLAGHVTAGRRCFISGGVVIHQFCRIGRLAMIGGKSGVGQDVPPFMIVRGVPAFIRSLNTVGLQRAGVSAEVRRELKNLYRQLYRSGKTITEALAEVDRESLSAEGKELIDFYTSSRRGVTSFERYRSRAATDASEAE
jgi:UDP-N-acetylglucosamine acyltransferase